MNEAFIARIGSALSVKIKSMIESFSFIREADAFAGSQGTELNKNYGEFSLN